MTSEFITQQAAAWTQIREQFVGHVETPNGPGSFMENTEVVRSWLPDIIERFGIKSMLDVPCGDWNWMQHVDLTGLEYYVGWDVEPDQIRINDEVFDGHHLGADNVIFECINVLTAPRFPVVDLIWCRDLMIHLPIETSANLWHTFLATGAKYLALTTCPWVGRNEWEVPDGGHDDRPGYWHHPVNLEIDPFFAANIVERIEDTEGREMILVKR